MPHPAAKYTSPSDARAVFAERGQPAPSRQTIWRWLTSTPGLGVKVGSRWLADRAAFEAIADGAPLADAARRSVGGGDRGDQRAA
jgi:hypothetical protein